MEKVELKVERTIGVSGSTTKYVEVEKQQTPTKTRRLAELVFCNEYINRDAEIARFDSLTAAKKFANLKISSRIM